MIAIHEFLDSHYGEHGDDELKSRISAGANLEEKGLELEETPLLVATRRRRLSAIKILVEAGANIESSNKWGKTSYMHAVRRSFSEVADYLRDAGCVTELAPADQFAVLVVGGQLDEAEEFLQRNPEVIQTGNAEEDRLLADVAGRFEIAPVKFLVTAGASLISTALDDGTPLHQAAWFGQPENARVLLDAGAPVDIFDACHGMSPLGWAVHGAQYAGEAEERKQAYTNLVKLLIERGSGLNYPEEARFEKIRQSYQKTLLSFAPPWIKPILIEAFKSD